MSKKKKLVRIDLASGQNKQKGFLGCDIVKMKGVDIVHDLTKYPWPFKDNSVDEIWCSHYVEHIPHGVGLQDGMVDFMNECYRIMKKGAIAKFLTPYYASNRAFQDPYHVRFVTEASYLYFTKSWREMTRLTHYPITADFEIVKYDHSVNQAFVGRASDAMQQMVMMNWNVIDDLLVTLKKK